jgi:hypothetical protein
LIFLISSLIIWFDFIFISILVLIIWFSFLFFFDHFFYFFNSTPHYLAHDFFEFDFYGSIQPHDPCHEFKRLNQVEFGLFLSAYSFFFFNFILQHCVGWGFVFNIVYFYFYVFILILYPES